jgi:LmbE family N-acetylglucosaminyl deacetylase
MSRNILVIAAHPDDEILGVGATMAKHRSQGDNVKVLILLYVWGRATIRY